MAPNGEEKLVNKIIDAKGKLEHLYQPKDVLLSTVGSGGLFARGGSVTFSGNTSNNDTYNYFFGSRSY